MQTQEMISEIKLETLAKHLAKEFIISQREALEIIYEEWDVVETLFYAHQDVKDVKEHLVIEMNALYRIA